MTTTTAPTTEQADMTRTEHYRAAERELWAAHGLAATERWVDVGTPRIRLRVVETGAATGRPVLFLPGTGGTGPYFAPLIHELGGVRALVADRPGWGLSDPVDYRGRDYGELVGGLLEATLDALGVEAVDVVGASIGNVGALRLAARAPGRVRRIVFLGGHPATEVPIPGFIKVLASPVGAILTRLPMREGMLRSQVAAVGHGPSLAAGRLDGFLQWRLALTNDTPSMRHERAMVRAVLDGDRWRPGFAATDADLAAVRQPLLMLFGTADPTGTVETWRDVVGRIPGGRLEVLDGLGHMPWWDDPALVGRAVREGLGLES